MPIFIRVRAMLMPLAALALAACASTTELLRSVAEAPPARLANTVLIAGISTDDARRQQYENIFLDELQRAGLKGLASSTIMPSIANLTMPEIRERMLAHLHAADVVLHVQLMNLVTTPTWSPDDLPAESAPASSVVGGVSLTLNAPPDAIVRGSQYTVELEATLYELPTRKLLWTAITRTHEANSPDAVARSHARALIRAMRKQGYLAR